MHFVKVMSSSAAVLIVALGVSVAMAQEPNGGMTPGGPPAAGPNAGAAPNGGQLGGESAPLPNEGAPGQVGRDTGGPGGSAATGSEPGSPKQMKENPTAQEQGGGTPSSREQEGKNAGKSSDHEGKAATQEGKTGSSREGKADAEGKAGTSGAAKAEGEGKGGARLGSQQVTKVKSYFAEHRPSVQRIEKSQVSVSIGVVLPSTVVLYDLPQDVVVVEGACPIKYFVWGDDIVLVDSCSRHVVEIIGGIA
jgi:hypothetical protein